MQNSGTDFCGKAIKLFIILIIWYSSAIQYFIHINNMLLLLGIGLVIIVSIDFIQTRQRFYFSQSERLLLIYIVFTFVFGLFVANNIDLHITRGTTTIEFFFVFLVLRYYTRTRGNCDFIITNYIVMYSALIIYFLINPAVASDYSDGIRYSFLPNANSNGFAIGITTCIWCILFKVQRGKIKPLIGFFITILYTYVMMQTGCRKALIGVIACISLWVLFCYFKMDAKKSVGKKIARVFLLFIAIVVILRVLLPIYSNSTIGNRMSDLFNQSDNSTLNRLKMYNRGFQLAIESPIFGNGFDAYRSVYGGYSHCDFIEVISSSGIFISLFYFLAYFVMILDSFRILRTIKRTQIQSDGLDCRLDIYCVLILLLMHIFYSTGLVHIQELESFINIGIVCSIILASRERIEIGDLS